MSNSSPFISVGMPVYNGKLYVQEAIESILAQSFTNFELIVSDNASNDGTEAICQDYAKKDSRIRCSRAQINHGAGWNLNRVVELSSGKYFMWAHHDDRRAPTYLAQCVEMLERNSSIVLCYSAMRDIDENGLCIDRQELFLNVASANPIERFHELIRMDHLCEPIFGLIRMDLLRKTPVIGNYPDSDRVLLAELALYGPFCRVPDVLFYRRAHALQSTAVNPSRQQRATWYDPSKVGKRVFPHFRQFLEYVSAIGRAPLAWRERTRCYRRMGKWILVNRKRLFWDLVIGFKQTLRPLKTALNFR
jgi:glycosyltransferase involved in cell wall biosynthesis